MMRRSLKYQCHKLQQLNGKKLFLSTATASPAATSTTASPTASSADYIIVGGGSAGCVLANRLSEEGSNHVTLLEAGPSDVGKWDSWKIQMPAALTYNLADDKYNWNYQTVKQKKCNNRSFVWPRGRVLGGSSSLNAMVYIRGHAKDYDLWAEQVESKDWDYAHLLPYFQKAQTHEFGPNAYRGGDGPLHVTHGTHLKTQPLFDTFVKAGTQAGYPYTEDMNGFQQEGFGPMDMTIYKGQRWNASNAYLRDSVEERSNLTIQTGKFVNRIIFEGKRAVGVEIEDQKNGTIEIIRANKEIILSAGAINSPQLLMLSGVGPAEHLKALDIPLVANLPGVGQNLQDHLDLYVQYRCKKPITLHHATWKYPHKMISTGLEWFMNKTGLATSAHLETGGFIRSRAGMSHPDLQYHFLPGALTGQLMPAPFHAMQAHCSPMRATSRGTLTLASKNPRDHPIIDPNYLDTEQDVIDLRAAVRLTREIFNQAAFEPYLGDAVSPTDEDLKSDASIDEWCRQNTESAYHPSCTNKMGSENDEMAVVASDTKIYGLEGIRIVDASIMPSIVSGNLNAPTIMLAEKAADVILAKTPLPSSTAPVYQPENWKKAQR